MMQAKIPTPKAQNRHQKQSCEQTRAWQNAKALKCHGWGQIRVEAEGGQVWTEINPLLSINRIAVTKHQTLAQI